MEKQLEISRVISLAPMLDLRKVRSSDGQWELLMGSSSEK